MKQLQPLRGTRDVWEREAKNHQEIIKKAIEHAELYGYNYIDTPIIESLGVFQKTLGETSDVVGKEMYQFLDRSGDPIVLRPEGTAPIVRALLSLKLTQKLPQKFYYHGPMFRYERPQKGRYRQFYQMGIECLGIDEPLIDAECIALAYYILKDLSLPFSSLTLHLNTLGDQESRSNYKRTLKEYFETYRHELSLESQKRLETNPLRILDSKNERDKLIAAEAPSGSAFLTKESSLFFDSLCQFLNILEIPFTLTPSLVRGLDYYCHTTFEFRTTALGAQDAVLGGGRYNGLVKNMGGPDIPGIGWAMGIDRLASLIENPLKTVSKIALIPIGDNSISYALTLLNKLRKEKIHCEMTYRGTVSKRFDYAEKQGCSTALIIGEEEINQGTIRIRSIGEKQKNEKEITEKDLITLLKKIDIS